MKKTIKKIVGIITVVVVSISIGGGGRTVKAIQIDTYGKNSMLGVSATSTPTGTLNSHYGTNPGGKCGAEKTITSINDFTADMLIAQGAANDDARVYRIQAMGGAMHEKPLDTYALYGAWDDNNVYLMWIMSNVTDVEAPDQNYPISDNGKPWNGDLCQMMLFNVDPSKGGSGAGSITDPKTKTVVKSTNLWNVRVNFETKVDKVALIHSNNTSSMQTIVSLNEDDEFDFDKGVLFNTAKGATTGSRFTWADGLPSCVTSLWGMQGYATNRKMGDMVGDTGKWVDYLKTSHSKAQDTTYLMTIPLKDLGIDKAYLTSKGIGLMHITTMGLSGLDSVPYDMSMNDVAADACPQDASTSAEKDDFDVITAPLASLGKIRDVSAVTVSKPSPTITTDVTGAQPANKKISFNTDVFGGEPKYTYQYYVDDVKVGEETASSTFEWTPKAEGDYTIKVVVKDSKGGKGEKEKKMTIGAGGIDPTTPPTIDPTTDPITPPPTDPTTPPTTDSTQVLSASDLKVTGNAVVGSALSIKATAAGGDGNYKYKFSITKDTTIVASKSYGTTDTFTWTPDSAGEYVVKATIKDGDGNEVDKLKTISITASGSVDNIPPVASDAEELTVSLVLGKTGIQIANNKIRLTASAQGGSGDYKYQFIAYKNNKKTIIKTSASESYFDWTPTEAGDYKLAVNVTDSDMTQRESSDKTVTIIADEPQISDNTYTGDFNSKLPISIMLVLSIAGITFKFNRKKKSFRG